MFLRVAQLLLLVFCSKYRQICGIDIVNTEPSAIVRASQPAKPAFACEKSGSVAMLFGLIALALVMVIGLSVDMARWLNARTTTMAAIDAAVLAGARDLQINGLNADAAEAVAASYYEANVAGRLPLSGDTIGFKVVDGGTALTAVGTAYLGTIFLKLAGIHSLPLAELSGSEHSKAVLAINGSAEFSLEVSLMLDVTDSMCSSGLLTCSSGEKIDAMKQAAKDLIDIVVWDNQGAHTSRVALVPFSSSVNLGTLDPSIVMPGPVSRKLSDANGRRAWWFRAPACAAERFGVNAYTDAAPSFSDRMTAVYTKNGKCQPGGTNGVVPLTNDKSLLRNRIDRLQASGSTGGHIGTAWSWYMLSPEWSSALPVASRPQPYSGLAQRSKSGRPLLRKVAVLMTDGDYNSQHCQNGQSDKHSNADDTSKGNCVSGNGPSADQARNLCVAMKERGITVYTVGFQLLSGSSAETTLSACASSRDHAFRADSAAELKQSFRNIALKISELHLAK